MNVPKILINKPIMHILMGTIVGIVIYLFWNQSRKSTVIMAVLFIFFIYKIYEKKYFILISAFFIIGNLSIFSYFNLVGNRYGIYSVRITKNYSNYSMGILQGRKVYVNSKGGSFDENEVIKFKGKFKRDIDINKGIVGDLFIHDVLSKKKDLIYKIRSMPKRYNEYLSKYIDRDNSAILTALTFGNKEFLSKEEKEKFKTLGIIHLICISGFHIAMVYEFMKKLSNTKVALIIALLYVFLTGLTASALRAYIMVGCMAFTTIIYKKYDNKNALALSALIILILKPISIIDIGFHLSYLATIGIILLYNFLNRGFYRIPKFIRESISLSLSAQLFIFPYMIAAFQSFSMNFLFGSLLLTPIVSLMLPLGIIFFFFYMLSIDITIFLFIIKFIFFFYNLILKILTYIEMPMIYRGLVFFIGYMLMIICFYMHYQGVSNFKFKELGYFFFIAVILGSFNFGVNISIFNKEWNKALVIEKGFYKEVYTTSKNEFFKEELKRAYLTGEVKDLSKHKVLKLEEDLYLYLSLKIEESFIMLKKNKYDIIDLLKEEKGLYHKGKFIYVDERGTK